MKNKYLQNHEVYQIQYRYQEFFVDLNDIYLGEKVIVSITQLLNGNKINNQTIIDFKLKCQCFYVEAAKQIYSRFLFRMLQPLKS